MSRTTATCATHPVADAARDAGAATTRPVRGLDRGVLGYSIGSVKTHTRRGMSHLRSLLKEAPTRPRNVTELPMDPAELEATAERPCQQVVKVHGDFAPAAIAVPQAGPRLAQRPRPPS